MRTYLEAGADALFIEAPQNLNQMETIGREFGSKVPLVHNLVEGGKSPVTDYDTLHQLSIKIALYPVALLHAFMPGAQRVLDEIHKNGNTDRLRDTMFDLADMNELLGAQELIADGEKYDGGTRS